MLKKETIASGLTVLFGAILLVGLNTVCSACGPKEDGSFMNCHWAGLAAMMTAAVLLVLGILTFIVRDGAVKRGIFLSMLPADVLMMVFPGLGIPLCMMPQMHCRMLMRPFVIAMGVLFFLAACAGALPGKRDKKA